MAPLRTLQPHCDVRRGCTQMCKKTLQLIWDVQGQPSKIVEKLDENWALLISNLWFHLPYCIACYVNEEKN